AAAHRGDLDAAGRHRSLEGGGPGRDDRRHGAAGLWPPSPGAFAGCRAGAGVMRDEISPREAAGILQMSRASVMRFIENGLLHPCKVLSRDKLPRSEVEALGAALTRQQRQALSNLVTLTEDYDF